MCGCRCSCDLWLFALLIFVQKSGGLFELSRRTMELHSADGGLLLWRGDCSSQLQGTSLTTMECHFGSQRDKKDRNAGECGVVGGRSIQILCSHYFSLPAVMSALDSFVKQGHSTFRTCFQHKMNNSLDLKRLHDRDGGGGGSAGGWQGHICERSWGVMGHASRPESEELQRQKEGRKRAS